MNAIESEICRIIGDLVVQNAALQLENTQLKLAAAARDEQRPKKEETPES